jgi:hypothetical protein
VYCSLPYKLLNTYKASSHEGRSAAICAAVQVFTAKHSKNKNLQNHLRITKIILRWVEKFSCI